MGTQKKVISEIKHTLLIQGKVDLNQLYTELILFCNDVAIYQQDKTYMLTSLRVRK